MTAEHKPVNDANTGRKRRAMQAAKLVPAIARGALRRQGFACSEVITRWAEIAGRDIAAHSVPLTLKFPPGRRRGGTLHVKADTAFALELQHRAPRLVERINRYYGYGAVERIAIVQAPLDKDDRPAQTKTADAPPAKQEPAGLRRRIDPVRDETLKESLRRLGSRIFGASS